jgi:hypothetical protein
MMNKAVRLSSLFLALTLTAGWLVFGNSTDVVSPPLRFSAEKEATLSGPYHGKPAPDFVGPAEAAACLPCHKDHPHKENTFSRAFLNLHAQRLDCLACHLEKGKRRAARLGWFELSLAGPNESSFKSANAFVAPYIPADSRHEVYESRSGQMVIEVSAEGKHLDDLDALRCSTCHSSSSPSILKDLGYGDDALERLVNLEYISKFDEGKEFYYTRF